MKSKQREDKGGRASVKPSLIHSQAIQAGLFGPERLSSRSCLLPGPLLCSFDPVRSCVFWRPAVWLLGPLTPAEEVQRHHEAGSVWRTRGDAEVTWSHSGAGTDEKMTAV